MFADGGTSFVPGVRVNSSYSHDSLSTYLGSKKKKSNPRFVTRASPETIIPPDSKNLHNATRKTEPKATTYKHIATHFGTTKREAPCKSKLIPVANPLYIHVMFSIT